MLLAFRVPVPTTFIDRLRNSHFLLPKQQTTSQQRGIHRTRHYALWGDYSITPYMSKEFLKDWTAATEWAKFNEPLFTYLAEELKFRDPATFAKMRGTPWLDNMPDYHVSIQNLNPDTF